MRRANKLKPGDKVQVVAPARSLAIISDHTRAVAKARFEQLGLSLSFAKHCEVMDEFCSSSIEQRVEDLHQAFRDDSVSAIFAVIGGHNSNQLLPYLDYDLIRNNPKIICGYSDVTALTNAIYAKTGLITYSGPAYSTLGMVHGIDYTLDYLRQCLFSEAPYGIENPVQWSDDLWFLDQENRQFNSDDGIGVFHSGQAKGRVVGGNLCTLNLLQGTEYMPDLTNSVLFIEDDELTYAENFDRDLQSLLQQRTFAQVRGLVIGKFQNKSNISEATLRRILSSKRELEGIPVLYNVSFGHTTPQICFPIGGQVEIDTQAPKKIQIIEH